MESTSTTNYQQVVVDVPEERVAEFHAFFARFLAGPSGRGRRGRPGRHQQGHRGRHGRRCDERHASAEGTAEQPDVSSPTETAPTTTTEV
jgi:hypothetical protein